MIHFVSHISPTSLQAGWSLMEGGHAYIQVVGNLLLPRESKCTKGVHVTHRNLMHHAWILLNSCENFFLKSSEIWTLESLLGASNLKFELQIELWTVAGNFEEISRWYLEISCNLRILQKTWLKFEPFGQVSGSLKCTYLLQAGKSEFFL